MEFVLWKIYLLIRSSLEDTYIKDEHMEQRIVTNIFSDIGILIYNLLSLFFGGHWTKHNYSKYVKRAYNLIKSNTLIV